MASLRMRREQMLASLKREQPRAARDTLRGGGPGSGSSGSMATAGRETDATAERSSQGLLQMQQQVMQQQDRDLESLERTVVGTKHIALQVRLAAAGAAGTGPVPTTQSAAARGCHPGLHARGPASRGARCVC